LKINVPLNAFRAHFEPYETTFARTENPCVAGSIPADTTEKAFRLISEGFFMPYTNQKYLR
jgi:hypothetical protein